MQGGRQASGDSSGSNSLSLDSITLKEHHGAPFPENEQERVRFLQKLNVLDTIGEDAFDVITRLLTKIYKVPIALVSLVDSSRQWFKSAIGLNVSETPRDLSFCAHLLLPEEAGILLVPDASLDPRFKNSPLVTGDPFIRYYCGAPIILGGVRLGSLCIIDRVPRESTGQKDAMLLANFADIVAGLIDKERKQSAQYEMLENPSFLIEVSTDKWPIMYSNGLGKELMSQAAGDEPSFFDFFSFDEEVPRSSMLSETRAQQAMCGERPCLCTFHPASRHGFAKEFYNGVLFPYSEPESSLPSSERPPSAEADAAAPQVEPPNEYNFVVVKWAEPKEGNSVGPSSSKSSSLMLFNQTPSLTVIGSPDDFDVALSKELSIIMLTSQFCAACVHFSEFYAMVCRITKGVQFHAVNVDDHPLIARRCTTGAVFLPSVYFYKEGDNVDQLHGSHCALFRQKLRTLLDGTDAVEGEDIPEDHETKDSLPSLGSERSPEGSPVPPDECVGPLCTFPKNGETQESTSSRILTDITVRLEAQRAYSKSLEALLSGSMAAQLVELRKDHEASLARIALLKRDLSTRRRSRESQFGRRGPGAVISEESEWSEEEGGEFQETAGMRLPQELPNYHFHGTVAKFLKPLLLNSKVLIYGGPRADFLESGMKQAKIDVSRKTRAARNEPIPTAGRRGRALAIVDVIDARTPQATWEWFEKVSDALSVKGILATISTDFDLLEVLGMLGETYGWAITCTEGSKRDYGIIVLEKGPESDALIRAWAVESFVEDST